MMMVMVVVMMMMVPFDDDVHLHLHWLRCVVWWRWSGVAASMPPLVN